MLPATAVDLVRLGEQIERHGRVLKLQASAIVDRSNAWQGQGATSMEDWLAGETGSSKSEAKRAVQTGKDLAKAPEVAEAAKAGRLSAQQTEAVAGAAAANPGVADQLIEAAGTEDHQGLKRKCAEARRAADVDPDATRRRHHAKRACRTWTDEEGVGHLHLSGPADAIARMHNAVTHRADRLFRDARTAGRREPTEAYAFDGAEELLTSGADGAPVPMGADAKILVRVDYPTLLRGHVEDGETCEIAGMGPIPVTVVREWMDDAFLAAVITRGSQVTGVAHLGRRFTAKQRTAMQWADPVCARKGCNNRLRLEYDHFDPWADTHTTTIDSAKRFCHACHRLKTLGWWVTEPDANGECTFHPPRTQDEVRAEIQRELTLLDQRGPPPAA